MCVSCMNLFVIRALFNEPGEITLGGRLQWRVYSADQNGDQPVVKCLRSVR